mmetsp:Transcript_9278/g.31432  ORF Transcript_9278/g.31432 Transcript_9278/m.31432 type:complete len:343 (+) Transcript_9278:49-1077(+)
MSDMMDAAEAVIEILTVVLPVVIVPLTVFLLVWNSFYMVKEREVICVERFGRFLRMLQPGINFIVPFADRPKRYHWRFYTTDNLGNATLVQRSSYRISNQNEVIDFPKQMVISRDNAQLELDAVLSWKVVNQRQMIYATVNLPDMLSKLMQAQLRNVAGSLDVDQIIEEASTLNVLTSMLDAETQRWGVKVLFVKVQRVDALSLSSVLAQKKNADLKNKEIVIQARATKQTLVIESEGRRDAMTKEAEGAMQEMISRARGQATAITNAAAAEARSVKEVARALAGPGERPAEYLIALRYLEVLRSVLAMPKTELEVLPPEAAQLRALEILGLNTAAIPASRT